MRSDFTTCQKMFLENISVEAKQQRLLNLRALRSWAQFSPNGFGIGEKAQALGECLHGLSKLTDVHGPYSKLAQAFESWITDVESTIVRQHDDASSLCGQSDLAFIEGLGSEWHAGIGYTTRKTEHYRGQIALLGEPLPGSTMETIAKHCESLIRGMSMALTVMRSIECQVLEGEREWVARMARNVPDECYKHTDDVATAPHSGQGIWHNL